MPSTERTALARLEELGDVLAVERERTGAPPDPGQEPGAAAIPPPRSAGLLRSNVVVATGTTLSRLTGLLRVIVFAYVIGKGALADAYLIGNETPNIVYELLLGGVLSATLVPLFTSFLHHRDDGSMEEDEAGVHATNVVITVTMVAVTVLTIVAFLAAPLIFGLYTIHTEGTHRSRGAARGRHPAHAGLPAADLLLRRHRPAVGVPQRPAALLRRRLEPDRWPTS